MCYVHVAALVAEYLWRKGEFRICLANYPFKLHCDAFMMLIHEGL